MPLAPIDIRKYIGRTLGSVTILKLVGQGAKGAVFIGFQRTLNRQVAVKVLPKNEYTNEHSHELFHREAQMVARLSHPNIIPIFEMDECDDCYFQVMQLIAGRDLETVIARKMRNPIPGKRTLTVAEAIEITLQVLDGLGYSHSEGVIHQDIKPSNILIDDRSGRAVIVDFGIAKTGQIETRKDGTVAGSPLYMAPERIGDRPSDHRVDIYAVGVVLFKMLTGNLPLANVEHDVMALLAKKLTDPDAIFSCSPSQASPLIDENLERIILMAIAGNPEFRYGSCAAFKEDLSAYQEAIINGPDRGESPLL
jgi:eukaryotic-like serine/threonine-protein kinase